eukprot:EG_transcript_39940
MWDLSPEAERASFDLFPEDRPLRLGGTNATKFSGVLWPVLGGLTGATAGWFLGGCFSAVPLVGAAVNLTTWGVTGAVVLDSLASVGATPSPPPATAPLDSTTITASSSGTQTTLTS